MMHGITWTACLHDCDSGMWIHLPLLFPDHQFDQLVLHDVRHTRRAHVVDMAGLSCGDHSRRVLPGESGRGSDVPPGP